MFKRKVVVGFVSKKSVFLGGDLAKPRPLDVFYRNPRSGRVLG